jgi:hypothetical protein
VARFLSDADLRGEEKMANLLTQRSHNLWIKTVIVASKRQRVQHLASTKRPAPTVKSAAEKEAEQWVAAMMFERYNS